MVSILQGPHQISEVYFPDIINILHNLPDIPWHFLIPLT